MCRLLILCDFHFALEAAPIHKMAALFPLSSNTKTLSIPKIETRLEPSCKCPTVCQCSRFKAPENWKDFVMQLVPPTLLVQTQPATRKADKESTSKHHPYEHLINRKRRNRKLVKSDSAGDSSKKCEWCGTTQTPEWRNSDRGETLCNACGLQLKKFLKGLQQQKKNQEKIAIRNLLN